MNKSSFYSVTLNLLSRSGAATAVATMLIHSPANSFAPPADQMAGKIAAAAARFLASEEFHEVRQVAFSSEPSQPHPARYRALFESEGWAVVHYSESPVVSSEAVLAGAAG